MAGITQEIAKVLSQIWRKVAEFVQKENLQKPYLINKWRKKRRRKILVQWWWTLKKKKVLESLKKSQGFLWDCWKSLSSVFLTKKFNEIHHVKESTKIRCFLNTKWHFISHEKSQSNNSGFHCPEKKILIVLIKYQWNFLT